MTAIAQAVKADPATFRDKLLIEADGKIVRLASVLEPWQARDFEALDGGLQLAAGIKPGVSPILRGYLERPRGHSKTTDVAIMVCYVLYSATTAIVAVAVAGDIDQGRLLLEAIAKLCRLNPALGSVLEVRKTAVVNRETGAKLDIISSDAPSSWGLLPDFIVIDELTHWEPGAEALWQSLISSAAKRLKCMVVIIANAGLGEGSSWQWSVREAARTSDRWYFSRLEGPQASWITPEVLDEQQRLLPRQVFDRVWNNTWSSAAGDLLEEVDILAAIESQRLQPREPGYTYAAGLDLGIKNDHSALVVLGINAELGVIRLASVQSWVPLPGQPVELDEIELACKQAFFDYDLVALNADPWQATGLLQRLNRAGYPTYEVPATPTNLNRFASALLTVFRNRQFRMYHDAALLDDLRKLQLVETPAGIKASAPRDRAGHCDRASALMLILPDAFIHVTDYQPPPPRLPATIFDLDLPTII